MSRPFVNALSPSRCGMSHPSLSSFYSAAYKCPEISAPTRITTQPTFPAKSKKEYTLIIVTESCNKRILLGLKNRGFGTGFYNLF